MCFSSCKTAPETLNSAQHPSDHIELKVQFEDGCIGWLDQTLEKLSLKSKLVGGWTLPLWKIWKSVGMMNFPLYGKCSSHHQLEKISWSSQPMGDLKNWSCGCSKVPLMFQAIFGDHPWKFALKHMVSASKLDSYNGHGLKWLMWFNHIVITCLDEFWSVLVTLQ